MLTCKYSFEKEIGRGSFSVVMKGVDKEANRPVAIKIIDLRGPVSIIQIRREVNILSMLDHPTIVRIYDTIITPNYVYIIMELIEGKDLLEFVNERGGLDLNLTKKMLAQMLSGLKYINSLNIMHRDLKCENIMVTADQNIKFIDFGLSRQKNNADELFTTMCGSLLYFAPEKILAQSYSFEADVWSLGIVLYGMVCCRLPFIEKGDETTETLVNFIVTKEPEYESYLPDDLINLLMGMLEKNPQKRLTLSEIIEHPFIRNEYYEKILINRRSIAPTLMTKSMGYIKIPYLKQSSVIGMLPRKAPIKSRTRRKNTKKVFLPLNDLDIPLK